MELAVAGQIKSQASNALPGIVHTAQLQSGHGSQRVKRHNLVYCVCFLHRCARVLVLLRCILFICLKT